jgi:hypothetical protein
LTDGLHQAIYSAKIRFPWYRIGRRGLFCGFHFFSFHKFNSGGQKPVGTTPPAKQPLRANCERDALPFANSC